LAQMAQLASGTLFGQYEIYGVAGRGGMGVVYRAHQLRLERDVALKVISSEIAEGPDFRARFARESRLAASIDHPHVVSVYDAGDDDALDLLLEYNMEDVVNLEPLAELAYEGLRSLCLDGGFVTADRLPNRAGQPSHDVQKKSQRSGAS